MSNKIAWAVVAVVIAAIAAAFMFFDFSPAVKPDSLSKINLPEGFRIDVFADLAADGDQDPGPRMMLIKNNVLYVTLMNQGKIAAIQYRNGESKASGTVTFIENLNRPHGIDYYNGWFYIAEENRLIRVKGKNDDLQADPVTIQVLIDKLPTGGHFTRTVKLHNNSLYLSIGSSCNVCIEQDERRAAIIRCDIDGKECKVYAKGLRNAVDFIFHPVTGKIYATDNGRDQLGEDLPPDEINMIEEGKNYGWPICYGKNIHDTDFDKNVYARNPCMEPFETQSLIDLQAHSAPLGLSFYYGDSFPQEYRGNLFIAFHGSWNRKLPTGYKIVRIDMSDFSVKDFATGWLQGTNVLGRPVGIIVAEDGSLFVSDDYAGKIYRISHEGS